MNYELVTLIRRGNPEWEGIAERLHCEAEKLISVLPSPEFSKSIEDLKIEGINLFDYLTRRSYDLSQSLFFNRAPVPSFSEIFMNEDYSISIIHEGQEIGIMELFQNTRRLVKNIQYLHENGEKDYIEEYAIDGKIFSEIFYFNNLPQEIHFSNDSKIPVISYFFYEGRLEYVSLNDQRTGEVKEGFKSLDSFISEQVAKIITSIDQVRISFLGLELTALSKTNSHNILRLNESPFDENGEVKGNLLAILTNKIDYIQEVEVSLETKQSLIKKGVPVSKVKVIRERKKEYES